MAGVSDRVQRSVPANFSAIALNGLCFPAAGRILGAGLLLTWFVSSNLYTLCSVTFLDAAC